MKGLIVKTTGLWYQVKVDQTIYPARLRGKFKISGKKITNPIAVGDWVEIESNQQVENEWVIEKIYERENYVARESPRRKSYTHLVATNIDQAAVIFTFRSPRTSIVFVDRFLVTLEAFRIPGIVILNKTDLFSEKEMEMWELYEYCYQSLGYQTATTCLTEQKPTHLLPILKDKRTLLFGHSGSGKSTLINSLIPEANQTVNRISAFADKGQHTTTFAEMFFLDEKTTLIDTPGIKELGLAEIESEELSHYFPEMRDLIGSCRFHDCSHIHEPGCAIVQAVEDGDIAPFRYHSYVNMLSSE